MAIKIVRPRSSSVVAKIVEQEAQTAAQKEYCRKHPDKYEDEIPKKVIDLDDKRKLVFSVRRKDDDEGLPFVDIRVYLTTDTYTGYTKQGINFSLLEKWDEFKKTLDTIEKELKEKGGVF